MNKTIEQLQLAADIAIAELREAIIEPVEISITKHVSIEVRPLDDDERINVCHDSLGWTTVNYTAEGVIVDVLPHEGVDPVHSAAIGFDELVAADDEPVASWDDLTPEQHARLDALRIDCDQIGLPWKEALLDLWATGRDAGQRDGHLLRQIRNQFGPTWLTNLPD